MEMEEHSPSQAKPAKLPTARCEVRFHTLGMGSVGCECVELPVAVGEPRNSSKGSAIVRLSIHD